MKTLFLSPHADDSELGAGGLMTKLVADNEVYSAVFSVCADSVPTGWPADTLKKEVRSASKKLGIKQNNLFVYDFKVRVFPKLRQRILDKLIGLREELNPDLVVMPSIHDYHQDHRVLADETIRAFKKTASIISYELPQNYVTFDTQLFVRLTKEQIQRKFDALQEYKSQLELERDYFKWGPIFGLAKVRGVQCSSRFAEAYEVLRFML